MKDLKKGEKIMVGALETEVEGFVNIAGQNMVRTEYGDFNIDIVKRP